MDKNAFRDNTNIVLNCPYCEVAASSYLRKIGSVEKSTNKKEEGVNFFIARCDVCKKGTVYVEKTKLVADPKSAIPNVGPAIVYSKVLFRKIIYPIQTADPQVPKPSKYMPSDVKDLYNETSNVFSLSPRSSGALIRVTLERLIKRHILTDSTGRLNDMIGKLSTTFPDYIIQLMDNIRTTGNNNSHDNLREIRDNEDKEKIIKLFEFINFICKVININEESNKMFNSLSEGQKKAIERRNEHNKYEK